MIFRKASLAVILLSAAVTQSRGEAPKPHEETDAMKSPQQAARMARGDENAENTGMDVIIRHGKIIDGTGGGWFYGDVGIKDGKIAAIGDLSNEQAAKEIDATGNVVTPGFIDVHTHADDDLYNHKEAENFVRDGVTTIVTGNCGGSVGDVGEYLAKLKTDGVGINVATLYGHNTILKATKGPAAGELTPAQWVKAKGLMDKAMRDGAVGLSTGLIYTPGIFSKTEEIVELNKISGAYGGIYATHMRSESNGIVDAINEALRVGREGNSRVEISHFKMPKDVAEKLGGADVTLKMVTDARIAGQEVWVDQYPYTASSTSLSTMLPDWVLEKGPAEAKKILKDPDQLKKVMADMKENSEVQRKRKDMSYAVVTSSLASPQYSGMNIKQITQLEKMKKEKADKIDFKSIPESQLPPVTMDEQYETIINIYLNGSAGCVFHTMNEKEVEDIMRSPLVSVCSDSGVRVLGEGVPHPRGYGSNARVLGKYVRDEHIITLEEAVRKMTSMPALAFRFPDRGLLRPGYCADVNIFNADTVTDKATYDDPHHYSEGFSYVIVNGEVVVDHDKGTGALPGMPIYGPGIGKNLHLAPEPVATSAAAETKG
ncbi:D-aminoacylase [soil metagenome]